MPEPAGVHLRERRRPEAAALVACVAGRARDPVLIFPLREGVPVSRPRCVPARRRAGVELVGAAARSFTALLSAAAFNFFHIPPTGRFEISAAPTGSRSASSWPRPWWPDRRGSRGAGRPRPSGAGAKADLAAQLARLTLSGTDLEATLERAGDSGAGPSTFRGRGSPPAPQEAGAGEVALALESGERRLGTLLPARTPP